MLELIFHPDELMGVPLQYYSTDNLSIKVTGRLRVVHVTVFNPLCDPPLCARKVKLCGSCDPHICLQFSFHSRATSQEERSFGWRRLRKERVHGASNIRREGRPAIGCRV